VPARFGSREADATERIARAVLGLRAHHAPGARIVALSSAHVLAPGPKALDADAPVRPAGEYGRARALAERILLAYEDVVVARLFGTLGPGLPAGLLVSDLEAALARGDAVVEMGGPDVARDWMDGRDAARALRILLEARPAPPRIVHVGTGRAIRASELAARLQRALGTAARVRFAPGDGPSWIADPSALTTLRFAPQHDLDGTARWIAAARARLRSLPEEPGAKGVHGGT
jgi:nucleoside-diphosphate-sugar epimerase